MDMKLKVVVIEDEGFASRRMVRLLEEKGVEVITVIKSVEEGIEWFSANEPPALIISDIQLSDGLSFSIFQAVGVESHIIFTTAYNQYALNAFKHNSVDYLLKPIDEEDLYKAIDKFNSYYTSNAPQTIDLGSLKAALFPNKEFRKRFLVKVGQFLKPVEVSELTCIYSEHKLTYFQLITGKNVPFDDSLEKVNDELDPSEFYRVNRKFVVAKSAVKEIVAYSNSRLKLIVHSFDKEEIIVAREKVKAFKEWMQQ